jgi:hypothetical protein
MFKAYKAWGYVAIRNKDREITGYNRFTSIIRSGIVRDFYGTPGAIIRQHPELAKCDKVVWELHDLA